MKGQKTGQRDLVMIEPDTLTLDEWLALVLSDGVPHPELEAWAERRCRR